MFSELPKIDGDNQIVLVIYHMLLEVLEDTI